MYGPRIRLFRRAALCLLVAALPAFAQDQSALEEMARKAQDPLADIRAIMSYNWEADSGDAWKIPLGLTSGQTLLLGNGDGLDLSVGAYDLVEKPRGGSDWQFKFGISYFFN